MKEYATRKENVVTELSQRKANLISNTASTVFDTSSSSQLSSDGTDTSNMDLDTLTSICEQADIEVTLDNLRSINNVMKETSRILLFPSLVTLGNY